MSDVLQLLL